MIYLLQDPHSDVSDYLLCGECYDQQEQRGVRIDDDGARCASCHRAAPRHGARLRLLPHLDTTAPRAGGVVTLRW